MQDWCLISSIAVQSVLLPDGGGEAAEEEEL